MRPLPPRPKPHPRLRLTFIAAFPALAAVPAVAQAKRLPSEAERAQLVGLQAKLSAARRACIGWQVDVSDDGRFATVGATFLPSRRCQAMGFNGYTIYRHQ